MFTLMLTRPLSGQCTLASLALGQGGAGVLGGGAPAISRVAREETWKVQVLIFSNNVSVNVLRSSRSPRLRPPAFGFCFCRE